VIPQGVSLQPVLKRNLIVVVVSFLSALACGATFLFALFRQWALVEVVASIAVGIEVYFFSSSIGELLEDRAQPDHVKMFSAIALAAAVVACFWISKFVHV
jgi:hypothetical protein